MGKVMPNDLQIAELVLALYHIQGPDYWDHFWPINGSYSAHKKLGEWDVLVWRGSVTSTDWLQDFTSYATLSAIGRVHAGFLHGCQRNMAEMDRVCGEKVILCGHSLGAGHAAVHGGFRLNYLKPLSKLVCFGEPRSGDSYMQWLYTKTSVNSYRNRDDPVTLVPDWLKHASEPLIPLNIPSPFGDFGILSDHHMKNYYEGLMGKFPNSPSTNPNIGDI